MATIGTSYPTLVDLATTEGEKLLIEILNQKNPMLDDMPWVECNDGTGHKTKVRTGLPTPTWRALYQGVSPTKGTFVPVRDATGNLEDYSEVDKMAYDLAGENKETWRLWEDAAHIEGISQTLASTVIYGNVTTSPEKFHGLAPRYNALTGVNTADNIVSAGGSGSDNTSIWLIGWSPTQGTAGLYPKGLPGGLQYEDLGQDTKVNSDGSMYQVMRTHYQWACGLTVRDWRTNGRICNIDVSDVRGTVANQKALITYLVQLIERVEEPVNGRQVLYANRTILSALRQGIIDRVSNNLTFETVEGKRVMMFDGIEFKRCDALLNTEATIS